jgi:hypothetical protein
MGTLAAVRFPQHEKGPANAAPSVVGEAKEGWRYVASRRGLVNFMFFFLSVNFVFGFIGVLYAPLVLSFAGAPGLGTVMALSGLGGIVGGVLMGVWGGPKRRAFATYWLVVLIGLAVALTGARASMVVVGSAAFLTMLLVAVVSAVGQVFWQLKIDPAFQGRVFALRNMFAMMAIPIAYLLAGPLADRVFEPAMRGGSPLANVFGPIIGVGEGRGLGLMCVFAGLLAALVALLAMSLPVLRNLDETVPDHEPATP